jgi:hypothetical protein
VTGYRDRGRRLRREEAEAAAALDRARALREEEAEVARIEHERRQAREDRGEEGWSTPEARQRLQEALAHVEALGIGYRRGSREEAS